MPQIIMQNWCQVKAYEYKKRQLSNLYEYHAQCYNNKAPKIQSPPLWILGALLFLTALLYNIMFFCKYDSIDLIIKP